MRKSFMLNFIITSIVLVFYANSVSAKVWVVNNNAGGPGDFVSAQLAHNASSTGDTLYFVGSTSNYGTLLLSKKLTLIGPGYFLNENQNTYSNKSTASFNYIYANQGNEATVTSGSFQSKLIGLVIDYLELNTNDIAVVRSKIQRIRNLTSEDLSGLILKQNYIVNLENNTYNFTNSIFTNNIFAGTSLYTVNSVIRNNTFLTNYGSDGSNEYVNNIFADYTNITFIYNMDSNNLRNNIFGGNKPSGSEYQSGINNVFSAYGNIIKSSGTSDDKFQLKEGSVAAGAGEDGVDCGAFGGSEPYILSGLPPIPVIYGITIPNSVNKNDGLQVEIKVKVQN